MLNIIKSKRVRTLQPHKGDQGWLNAIYLWERFDIGQEYNLLAATAQFLGLENFMENATILQFAGPGLKLYNCPTEKPWLTACKKWEHYRQKLEPKGNNITKTPTLNVLQNEQIL